MKKSAFALALSLVTNQAIAQEPDCSHITNRGLNIIIGTRATGPYPFAVANVTQDIDTVRKQVCYKFEGLKLFANRVQPSSLCVKVEDQNAKDTPVNIVFPGGEKVDVSEIYAVLPVRAAYDRAVKACNAKLAPGQAGI